MKTLSRKTTLSISIAVGREREGARPAHIATRESHVQRGLVIQFHADVDGVVIT